MLKLPKIPDRTPVKLSILVPPELNEALTAYGAAYSEAYGQDVSVPDLIPPILAAFIDGDREFARKCKAREPERRK